MTKQELRKQIANQIKTMSEAEREAQSHSICLQIIDTEIWQQARAVLLYCALPDEVSLQTLITQAYQNGKTVVLPVVDGESLLLRIYQPQQMAVQGRFKILEPTEACPLFTAVEQLDLAIIPGRAFTREGDRMGRGKGFYDRLLPQLQCEKWGVGFDCQLVAEIPTDTWDVRLNRILISCPT